MADFAKMAVQVAAQRAAREQAAGEPPAPAPAKPAKRQGTPSKRQGWKAATFYVRPETLAQLRRVVGMRKLEGQGGDLSDAVEEALQAWLSNQDQA
jgi:hypothetical protein